MESTIRALPLGAVVISTVCRCNSAGISSIHRPHEPRHTEEHHRDRDRDRDVHCPCPLSCSRSEVERGDCHRTESHPRYLAPQHRPGTRSQYSISSRFDNLPIGRWFIWNNGKNIQMRCFAKTFSPPFHKNGGHTTNEECVALTWSIRGCRLLPGADGAVAFFARPLGERRTSHFDLRCKTRGDPRELGDPCCLRVSLPETRLLVKGVIHIDAPLCECWL